jgi:uncharacterized protein with HEPN domain
VNRLNQMQSMRSKEKTIRQALKDIRENTLLAKTSISALNYEGFIRDMKSLYAVPRCLEIISGASRRLPQEILVRHPHITWTSMAAAGKIYRHEYEKVEELEIWNTIRTDLPPLLAAVDQELNRKAGS